MILAAASDGQIVGITGAILAALAVAIGSLGSSVSALRERVAKLEAFVEELQKK